jgi:threonine/homoserine/homoserine lactone efflux protein
MTEPSAFAFAALALLATPGPTNALLATSAASAGALRSAPLALATVSFRRSPSRWC